MYNMPLQNRTSEVFFVLDTHIHHKTLKEILLSVITAHAVDGVGKMIMADNLQIKGK